MYCSACDRRKTAGDGHLLESCCWSQTPIESDDAQCSQCETFEHASHHSWVVPGRGDDTPSPTIAPF